MPTLAKHGDQLYLLFQTQLADLRARLYNFMGWGRKTSKGLSLGVQYSVLPKHKWTCLRLEMGDRASWPPLPLCGRLANLRDRLWF